MSTRYRISEDDCVRAGMLHAKPTRRASVVLILIAIQLGALLFLGIVLDWQSVGIIGGAGVIGGAVGWLTVSSLVNPWMARHSYRRYKLLHEEMELTVQDDGIRLASTYGESRLEWSKFLKWRCNADYVLIYVAPRMYYPIPSTVAAQGFDLERLKDLLARHVGPPV